MSTMPFVTIAMPCLNEEVHIEACIRSVAAQDYLGIDKTYYHPVPRGFEAELATRLETIRERLRSAKADQNDEIP